MPTRHAHMDVDTLRLDCIPGRTGSDCLHVRALQSSGGDLIDDDLRGGNRVDRFRLELLLVDLALPSFLCVFSALLKVSAFR